MKRTSPRRVAPSLSLAPSSSLPLDGPYCLPCVTRAHLLSYLFIIYVITHAWTSPEKYPRDHEHSFFLDIMLAHLQLLVSLSPSLPHTHVNRGAHTHTYVHTREEAKLTRPFVVPLWRRSAAQLSRGFLSLTRFSFARKMGKNRAKRRTRFLFFSFFFCRIDTVLAALTRIYKKITYAGVARS